jgi:murein DD-endopeptidase MepM/ murein hydrolase activator NlpD
LAALCGTLVILGGVAAFFWYGAAYRKPSERVTDNSRIKETQASLDQLRNETAHLLREAKEFESALSGTLETLGIDVPGRNDVGPDPSGDLASFLDVKETPDGILQEVEEVRRLAGYLSQATKPVQEIGGILNSQHALLTEIPSIWPIQGGIGHISQTFGQNPNPFSGLSYIHTGIDLSTYRQGDPIVATADGQIATVDYDANGYGNYVIIKHKHGFYTRYGHMLSVRARTGQRVQQGEVIGYIGNTGLSTGPHVHYEVHIGSDLVDPYKYMTIRSNLARSR